MHIKTFGDLMGTHKAARIKCPVKGSIVRRFVRVGDTIAMYAMEGHVLHLSPTTPVSYTPWDGDRGNLTFTCDQIPGHHLKLCTELDIVQYPDGSIDTINADNPQTAL